MRVFLEKKLSLFSCYTGAGFGLPYWDFLGTTMVTSSHVRLTADKRSQTGAIWNNQVCLHMIVRCRVPLIIISYYTKCTLVLFILTIFHSLHVYFQPVWSRNWEMQIHFRVTGTKKDLFGDGFAIW